MKKKLLIICLVCLSICRLFAETDDMLTGLDAYSRGDWITATEAFERALITMPGNRTEALYWLVMSETSAENYRHALDYADAFLTAVPEDEHAAEVSYQKGRLLHLSGDYEKSSDVFYRFIKEYPEHPKVPSAYYWIGENLYAAGNYAEARNIFNQVVVNYPQSGKVNEARYKIVMIDQQLVRDELLRMANEVNATEDSVQVDSEGTEPTISEPQYDESKASVVSDNGEETATVADDSALIEEQRRRNEELSDRLTALEEKLKELSETLSRIAEEQENQRIREQQQAFERQQQAEQQQKEQEEAERLQLEERRRELTELKQRTQTLEKLYEQRMKGAK